MTSSSSYPISISSATVAILRWATMLESSKDLALRLNKNSSGGTADTAMRPDFMVRLMVASNSCGIAGMMGWPISSSMGWPVIGSTCGCNISGVMLGSSYCEMTDTVASGSDSISMMVCSSRPVYSSMRTVVRSSHHVLTTPHLRISESLKVEYITKNPSLSDCNT